MRDEKNYLADILPPLSPNYTPQNSLRHNPTTCQNPQHPDLLHRPSQMVRPTPLGMSCSELPGHDAPRPGLRMSLRLRFCPQSGYVPVLTRGPSARSLSSGVVTRTTSRPRGNSTRTVSWRLVLHGPNLSA